MSNQVEYKRVLWLSESQFIPTCGMAYRDKELLLPDPVAKDFVERKMAKYAIKRNKGKESEK